MAEMTQKQMEAELAKLRAENEDLRKRNRRDLHCSVGQKGGVVVGGLGRYPLTLYKDQMLRFLDFAPNIRKFIEDNDSKLKSKE